MKSGLVCKTVKVKVSNSLTAVWAVVGVRGPLLTPTASRVEQMKGK